MFHLFHSESLTKANGVIKKVVQEILSKLSVNIPVEVPKWLVR
jgi:hypothetical protein